MADDVVIEDPIGLIANLRGYWNMDIMKCGQEGEG